MFNFFKKMFSNNEVVLPSFPEPSIWTELDGFLEQKNIAAIFSAYSHGSDEQKSDIIRYMHVINNYEAITEYCASQTQHYFSHLIQGIIHSKKAQQSRGGQSASETSDAQINGMFKFSEIALNNFDNALELNDQDGHIYAEIMTPLLYLSAPKEEFWKYYDQAKTLSGSQFSLHTHLLNCMTEKWLGSHQEMFQLAQTASDKAANGHALHGLIALAHAERWLYFGMADEDKEQHKYFKKPSVQSKIMNAYERFYRQRGSSSQRDNYKAAQFFSFCFYMMDDDANFAQEFDYLNQSIEFDEIPWCYVGANPFELHYQMRAIYNRENK